MNRFPTVGVVIALAVACTSSMLAAPAEDTSEAAWSASILSHYLDATQSHSADLSGISMEVDIDAQVPKLKKQGKLRALRKISSVGKITYRVLGFQGDDSVKKEVIGRFLAAEQQAQDTTKLAVAPANYKFRFKGKRQMESGLHVYVFQLSPRKRAVGLFKGEVWLDTQTYLPLVERGRFVKNPSVFFRRVSFQREFAIENGIPVPRSLNSTIDTRLVGPVQLRVSYLRPVPESAHSEVAGTGAGLN